VERKGKILVAKWDSLCKHASWQKVLNNFEISVKKGSGIIPKIISIPKTIHCLFLVANRLLLPNLEMGMQNKREFSFSNLP
jgi:hypothetical protein